MAIIKTSYFQCLIVLMFTGVSSLFAQDSLQYADESHFKNIQQLTFGGDNAEAYFSFDGFSKNQPQRKYSL
jgi:hypothetical protein